MKPSSILHPPSALLPEPPPGTERRILEKIGAHLTGTMPIVCNWCPVPHQIGTKPCLPEFDGQISHGICRLALEKTLEQEASIEQPASSSQQPASSF